MTSESGGELLVSAIPNRGVAEQLRSGIDLPLGSHDVYLAYSTSCGARFAGYLVSASGTIDAVIAHCPVPVDLEPGSGLWQREVARQRSIACRIATEVDRADKAADAIWLDGDASSTREMPPWIFSLACVPLTYEWDGRLLYPRPFCHRMFESLAKQPEAPHWLLNQLHGNRGDETTKQLP